MTLHLLAKAEWSLENRTFHIDFKIPRVKDLISVFARGYLPRLFVHPNELVTRLAADNVGNVVRRLN